MFGERLIDAVIEGKLPRLERLVMILSAPEQALR
jgi:hypothetical protein